MGDECGSVSSCSSSGVQPWLAEELWGHIADFATGCSRTALRLVSKVVCHFVPVIVCYPKLLPPDLPTAWPYFVSAAKQVSVMCHGAGTGSRNTTLGQGVAMLWVIPLVFLFSHTPFIHRARHSTRACTRTRAYKCHGRQQGHHQLLPLSLEQSTHPPSTQPPPPPPTHTHTHTHTRGPPGSRPECILHWSRDTQGRTPGPKGSDPTQGRQCGHASVSGELPGQMQKWCTPRQHTHTHTHTHISSHPPIATSEEKEEEEMRPIIATA